MSKLSDEQRESLRYFWEEKGDITRYCDFERLKPVLRDEFPEILTAWDNYQASIKAMDIAIRLFEYYPSCVNHDKKASNENE